VAGSNNTQFDIAFGLQTGPETVTMTLDANIASAAGQLLDQNQNGVLGEASDGFSASFSIGGGGGSGSTTFTSVDTPLPIRDFQYTESTVTVPTDTVISKITVKINLTHTYDSDLQIWIVGPSGYSALLVNRRGGSGDNFNGTVFDSSASLSIVAGAAPFSGTYRPEQSLAAAYNGYDAKGTWTLVIRDVAAQDIGTLNSWSLTIQGTSGTGLGPANVRLAGLKASELAWMLGNGQTTGMERTAQRLAEAATCEPSDPGTPSSAVRTVAGHTPLALAYSQGMAQHSRVLQQADGLLAAFFTGLADVVKGLA